MRRRLSARYTAWQKLLLPILLFIFLLVTGICSFILSPLPDLGIGNYAVASLFIFGCYKLVDYLFREKKVVEFVNRNLFVVDKVNQQEEAIPFECILKLNMRPYHIHVGNYWFHRYILHYMDPSNQEQRTQFFIKTGNVNIKKFLEFIQARQPSFICKDWTHSFDLFDQTAHNMTRCESRAEVLIFDYKTVIDSRCIVKLNLSKYSSFTKRVCVTSHYKRR